MKKIYLSVLIFLCTFPADAQNSEHKAPTLQLGLDGLSFARGSLDAQLITEIIAEKQSEIKLKLVQNIFLGKLSGTGGTLYTYGDNVIRGILQEPNSEIRTRKILESTVNLVFVYTFADFYLRQLKDNDALNKLIQVSGLEGKIDPGKGIRSALLRKDGLLQQTQGTSDAGNKQNVLKSSDTLRNFIVLIVDMCSEAVREDATLKELGLMRISYSNTYDYLNEYRRISRYESNYYDEECTRFGIGCRLFDKNYYEASKPVFEDMKKKLSNFTDMAGAINFISNQLSFRYHFQSYFKTGKHEAIKIFNDEKITFAIDSIIDTLNAVAADLVRRWELKNDSLVSRAIKELMDCKMYLTKANTFLRSEGIPNKEKRKFVGEIIYTLSRSTIPQLTGNVKYHSSLLKNIDQLKEVSISLAEKIIGEDSTLKEINGKIDPFLKLAARLYEFDQSSTYSDYLGLLSEVDNLIEDHDIKDALGTINSFVKDYITIQTDENGKEMINFNVESFVLKLQNISSSKIRRFQLHFSVGMNTSFFYTNLVLENQDTIRNFSNISEKIGIKFKLISKGDWWPKNPGETYGSFGRYFTKTAPPKEPLISNWHLLFYGSGILYNVINTGTNKEFKSPVLGAGTGVTFYNALDLNASWGIPLSAREGWGGSFKHVFFNVGFDIRFTEYLDRLNQKRKSVQTQKRLAEATAP